MRVPWLCSVVGALALGAASTRGVASTWTNTAGGKWEDASWSDGIPIGQSATITNAGAKTIVIDDTTYAAFPGSLSVGWLTLAGAGSVNRLVIKPSEAPLAFSAGRLQLGTNGLLKNNGAEMQVRTDCSVWGSLVQSGGAFSAPGIRILRGGIVAFTNVDWALSGGVFVTGTYRQRGGTNTAGAFSVQSAGVCEISDGVLRIAYDLPIGTRIYDGQARARFAQAGGLVTTANLLIGGDPSTGGEDASYTLTKNGTLRAGSIRVVGDSSFAQSGGSVTVSGPITAYGKVFRHGGGVQPAYCGISAGTLTSGSITLDYSTFNQSGGSNHVGGTLSIGGYYDYMRAGSFYYLSGGQLVASQLSVNGIFSQSGGTNRVDSLVLRNWGGPPHDSQYHFSDGHLMASNITIYGTFDITGSGRISNPGYCELNGVLSSDGRTKRLGRLVLGSGRIIMGTNVLRFADSSGERWQTNGALIISRWNGSLTGGGECQLVFGTNDLGLAAEQLAQVRFENPSGLPPGNYRARIRRTGEVVPATDVLFRTAHQSSMILNWYGPYTLQTATNIQGPWRDLPAAGRPYTNAFSAAPQRFFRLRP